MPTQIPTSPNVSISATKKVITDNTSTEDELEESVLVIDEGIDSGTPDQLEVEMGTDEKKEQNRGKKRASTSQVTDSFTVGFPKKSAIKSDIWGETAPPRWTTAHMPTSQVPILHINNKHIPPLHPP